MRSLRSQKRIPKRRAEGTAQARPRGTAPILRDRPAAKTDHRMRARPIVRSAVRPVRKPGCRYPSRSTPHRDDVGCAPEISNVRTYKVAREGITRSPVPTRLTGLRLVGAAAGRCGFRDGSWRKRLGLANFSLQLGNTTERGPLPLSRGANPTDQEVSSLETIGCSRFEEGYVWGAKSPDRELSGSRLRKRPQWRKLLGLLHIWRKGVTCGSLRSDEIFRASRVTAHQLSQERPRGDGCWILRPTCGWRRHLRPFTERRVSGSRHSAPKKR